MEQEPRPYLRNEWPELAAKADEHWSEPAILQSILEELKFRSRPGARELRNKVTQRLVQLSSDSFLWPGTAVGPSWVALQADQFDYSHGLLRYMGYRVGQQGAIRAERQHILDYVYNETVPRVNSASYMAEWGSPKTGTRLQKTAESIAAFVRNAKRKHLADMALAIQEWEEDLMYIKGKYYDGRYDRSFEWPRTDTGPRGS
jgi:hypothetical protein